MNLDKILKTDPHDACRLCRVAVNGLTVTAQGETLLADVSLHIHCGQLTALVGRYAPEQPLEGALQLVTKWIWPMETDGQGVLSGMEYRWKTSKPDTDNLIKMLKDCMTRTGYWKDDAQVVSEITQKFYGPKAGIYIEVVRMD